MNAALLLKSLIYRQLKGADVEVGRTETGYRVTVIWKMFETVDPGDRQALVYRAIEKAPLELLAKITDIDCRVE